MRFSWTIYGGAHDEVDSEDDTEYKENLVPPKGVSDLFCSCVDSLKWSLYEAVVLGPEWNTPEAQRNDLLQTYETLLEKLFVILSGALKGRKEGEADLRAFPEALRPAVQECVRRILTMQQAGGPSRDVDRVPYQDYLQTQLRIYPYLQYRGRRSDE